MTMRLAIAALILLLAAPAAAQDRDTPYWASIRAKVLNMRAGPGPDFPIEWVYRRAGLPIKVIRVHEGWRLVRYPAGAEGWVTANLLSIERGALVIGDGLAAIRAAPQESAALRWNAEPGVVGKLGDCDAGWCEFDVAGRAGYMRQDRLWGAGEP
ncbi:MAG: SH3 domain-containing protein [Tsuneonella sp.]